MAITRKDTRLWAYMVGRLVAAGVEDAETLARVMVFLVRREQDPDSVHFAPGDAIPNDVVAVSDLDGDVWERESADAASGQRDHWTMRDYDADEHESAAAGVQLTPFLATAYGPLTTVATR